MQLTQMPIHALGDLLQSGEITSRELVESTLARIEAKEGKVGAYLAVDTEGALAQAKRADAMLSKGGAHALCGIPIAIKDCISTKGLKTTCASRLLEDYVPPFDATVVAKLKEVGAIIIGKTNLDEFAMGSSTETSAYKITANPWDLSRTPGGSSGGSAAAVAAGEASGALGTDTGGSIRQPAAFCGMVGLKPTYGLVSRYGLFPVAPSMDHIGPMTLDVEDAWLLLKAIAGKDPRDPVSHGKTTGNLENPPMGDIKGMTLGLATDLFDLVTDDEMGKALGAAVEVLRSLGAKIREVSLPHGPHAMACFHLLASGEIASSLGSFDGVRLGWRDSKAPDTNTMFTNTRTILGSEVKRRILTGTAILQAKYRDTHYDKMQRLRTLIIRDLQHALADCDVLVAPTVPGPAFALGCGTTNPEEMYKSDVFTSIANLAGIPALTVPTGLNGRGLPLAIQFLGRHYDDATVLEVGQAYEKARPEDIGKPDMEVKANG